LIRQVVTDLVELVEGIDPARVFDLLVAVSEACTNAVEAHHRDGVGHAVAVRGVVDVDRVLVEVEDRAGGFTYPGEEGVPDAAGVPVEAGRGRGVPLMRALADHIEVQSSADGTKVKVTMYTG